MQAEETKLYQFIFVVLKLDTVKRYTHIDTFCHYTVSLLLFHLQQQSWSQDFRIFRECKGLHILYIFTYIIFKNIWRGGGSLLSKFHEKQYQILHIIGSIALGSVIVSFVIDSGFCLSVDYIHPIHPEKFPDNPVTNSASEADMWIDRQPPWPSLDTMIMFSS